MSFECIKTGAHIRLWNGYWCVCDVFDLGDSLLFQCMPTSAVPERDVLHFEVVSYDKTYSLSDDEASDWIIITSREYVRSFGYRGLPITPAQILTPSTQYQGDFNS